MAMRLDRYLAECGAGTRSEVKKFISGKRVSVNGTTVKDASCKVEEQSDRVELDGMPVRYAAVEYYLLNKPQGVLSASKADLRDPSTFCVVDLIRDRVRDDLFPVGRLDKDTEGLLIITNDGVLAHGLLSPKRRIDKTYYAELDGTLSPEAAERLQLGVDIGDPKPTLPCRIRIRTANTCEITIHEGRYHEVKRIFATEGLKVTYLKRLSMGPLQLDPGLQPGDCRPLTKEEISLLQKTAYPKAAEDHNIE